MDLAGESRSYRDCDGLFFFVAEVSLLWDGFDRMPMMVVLALSVGPPYATKPLSTVCKTDS